MWTGLPTKPPSRSLVVSCQSTCHDVVEIGSTEPMSVLTVTLAARTNGDVSGVPFKNSFIFAVAGSLVFSMPYTQKIAFLCTSRSGVTRRADDMNDASDARTTRGSAGAANCAGPTATASPNLSTSITYGTYLV